VEASHEFLQMLHLEWSWENFTFI